MYSRLLQSGLVSVCILLACNSDTNASVCLPVQISTSVHRPFQATKLSLSSTSRKVNDAVATCPDKTQRLHLLVRMFVWRVTLSTKVTGHVRTEHRDKRTYRIGSTLVQLYVTADGRVTLSVLPSTLSQSLTAALLPPIIVQSV